MVAQIRAAATDSLEAVGLDHRTAVDRMRQSADELTQEGVIRSR
jgi:hypothetical protein